MRFRLSRQEKNPVLQRAGILLIGLGLLLLGAITGLLLALPTNALTNRLIQEVEAQTQTEIDISGGMELALPLTLRGAETTIHPLKLAQFPPLRIDHFQIRPLWSALLTLNPGVSADVGLMNGRVEAAYRADGSLNLKANDLLLDLPIEQGFSLKLLGRLLQGQLETVVPLSRETTSRLTLSLDQVRLLGLTGQENGLRLGTIVLELNGEGNSFRVAELSAVEGDFTVTGSGRVLLGNTPAASRLNLRLTIRPQATADPTLVDLLRMTARENSAGAYQLRLGGSLARPVLN
jgi:type II secretion system protein N